jgi:hypothetical protein
MRDKLRIPAMREHEVKEYLTQSGIADTIDSGELECPCCGTSIGWSDVGGFIVTETGPVVFCSSLDCVSRLQKEDGRGNPT